MKTSLLMGWFVCFALVVGASYVVITSPIAKEIPSGEVIDVDLGVVGPGQKIEIVAKRSTGEKTESGPNEALWDQLVVLDKSLPIGWKNQSSLLYENPLKAFVIVSKDSLDGTYTFFVKAEDYGEGINPLLFRAKVRVSRNLLDLDVVEKTLTAGVGHPATYTIKLRNKGNANDVFEISAQGLPKEWKSAEFIKNVFIPYNSEQSVSYEVMGFER
ncbi:hypothetical protein HY991_04860, partial [Candidatus Micrarchaeota archaeon]|nr:hypothetical protein [Candidatus Micrarchaeota archaeon]